jgi:hypothetical protein
MSTMNASRMLARVALFALALALSACARHFDIQTPSGMIELSRTSDYSYRAMTPDGVVVGVRVIPEGGKADLAFWTQAVALRMKELSGYAVADTASLDGVKGKELRFGHDESGKPYSYIVRIFVEGGRLFVVEAGGMKDEMERSKQTVEWTLATLKLK